MDILIKIGELVGYEPKVDAYYNQKSDNADAGWYGDATLALCGKTYKGHVQSCGDRVVLDLDAAAIAQLELDEVPFVVL